jgi:hypothetical protein
MIITGYETISAITDPFASVTVKLGNISYVKRIQ